MFDFSTPISDCDYRSPALLNSFLSCNASICSAMAFPPLRSFDHVVVSVSIGFPSNSKRDAPFTLVTILLGIGVTILGGIGVVFVTIWEMFFEGTSLN